MPVLLADQPCLDPGDLYHQCVKLGISTAWHGEANSFRCSLGAQPGEGWVLLSRKALREIDPVDRFADLVNLTFKNTAISTGQKLEDVTLKNLVIVGADCVTPAARDQDESAYLVRLADRRLLANRVMVDVGYNLRHITTQAYLPATLRNLGGSRTPWTWAALVEDLWTRAGKLGTWPGLPTTPNGVPEDIECWQMPALEALQEVLTRLRMGLAYDPIADTFTIVGTGSDSTAFDDALAKWEKWRHWDIYALQSNRGQIPEKVRVLFKRLPHVRGEGSPFYAIEVDDPLGDVGQEEGTFAVLHDDLHALFDATGTLTNESLLQSRATARAEEFYRSLRWISDRMRIVYPFALADLGLRPNSQVLTTRWGDTAGGLDPHRGMMTEIVRVGSVGKVSYPGVTHDPLTQIIRVTGRTGPNGLVEGYIQAWDATGNRWVDRDTVWVKDANQ